MKEKKSNKKRAKKGDDIEIYDLLDTIDEKPRTKRKRAVDTAKSKHRQPKDTVKSTRKQSIDTIKPKRKQSVDTIHSMRKQFADTNRLKRKQQAETAKREHLEESTKQKKNKRIRNKEFARVTYLFVFLFLFMSGYIVYFNVVRSKDIISSPYNVRQDTFADRVVRGKIFDRNGNVLAQTKVAEDGSETREYPYGNVYAHVVGYATQGKAGIESVNNVDLLTSNAFFLERMMKELRDEKNVGDNLVTTLHTHLQEAAYQAMGSNRGAVIVIEPSTGKILASVSKPDFNPNDVVVNWESLNSSEDSKMLNRAMQGKYAPGSTFKVVSSLAYMRENPNFAAYSYYCEGAFTHEGTTIQCMNHRAHGTVDLEGSLAYSCNASYSNLALQLDVTDFQETASSLLFDETLPAPLQASNSQLGLDGTSNTADRMMTAIGQGKLQVSPYHMALIAAAIANDGTLMKPYLVSEVQSYTGSVVKKHTPSSYGDIMTMNEAMRLSADMQAVVNYGTGSALSGRGYTAAGKTGTAEVSTDKAKTHSWFMGFRNVENPDLAICVVIENSDESGASAVSVARAVFDAYQ